VDPRQIDQGREERQSPAEPRPAAPEPVGVSSARLPVVVEEDPQIDVGEPRLEIAGPDPPAKVDGRVASAPAQVKGDGAGDPSVAEEEQRSQRSPRGAKDESVQPEGDSGAAGHE
jgi:hypothetical protein